MNRNSLTRLAICAGSVLGIGTASAVISLASHDTFAADVENWQEGNPSPNPPTHSANPSWDGNPGYLINTSDGSGQGGRFVMWNDDAEWTGDYTGAGVTSLGMWIDNRSGSIAGGNTAIPVRVALNGPGGWFMSDSIVVSDDIVGTNEWQKISFDIGVSDMSYVGGGSNDYSATMADVSHFEILVNASGSTSIGGGGIIRGDNVIADLRFDDIRAEGIPEPTTFGLSLLGALVALGRRKR